MRIVINPGTEPIGNATEQNATINITHLITDLGGNIDWIRIPEKDYGEGRYAFLLWKGGHCHEIQMPGLTLGEVRYIDLNKQNIWNFPRLYVDGASWVWKFAINVLTFNCDQKE